ncbi:MAG: AAA family ATPase [Planctomycetota bacterium]
MTLRSNILLITKDNTTADMLKAALNKSRDLSLAGICREVSELRVYLDNTAPQAVVVDIDPEPSQILHDLGTVVAMYPEMRVIVVSSSYNNELILKAMQAGARHFLRKKSIEFELVKILRQLIPVSAKSGVKLGSVISVFSSSGGCGATTIAINLANELRLASARPVLTVDLDNCYGTVAAYLGIKGQYGIADVLAHKKQIDKHLIQSSASSYTEDFHVLVSPASIESPRTKSLQYENLTLALEACRQAYKYTVVDAPRIAENPAKKLASVSKVVLVVFQLTVKDLRFAGALISSLIKSGVTPEKIVPLANRFKRRGLQVRLEDGKKALGLDCLHQIRNDWRKTMSCVNRGQLLAEIAPRSGLRRDFQKLVAQVNGIEINGSNKVLR